MDFFAKFYRRSDDQILDFLAKFTDDPNDQISDFFENYQQSSDKLMIFFGNISLLPRTLRQFTNDGFKLKFREYLKMMVIFDFTDDPTIIIRIFWLNFTDDPTITIWIFWLFLPTIRRSLFSIWFSILAITETLGLVPKLFSDDPTIIVFNWVQNSRHN